MFSLLKALLKEYTFFHHAAKNTECLFLDKRGNVFLNFYPQALEFNANLQNGISFIKHATSGILYLMDNLLSNLRVCQTILRRVSKKMTLYSHFCQLIRTLIQWNRSSLIKKIRKKWVHEFYLQLITQKKII